MREQGRSCIVGRRLRARRGAFRSAAPRGGVRMADSALRPRAEGVLKHDQSGDWTPPNVWRLCCRADRAPGAAPTAFALGFKRLRRARGPRPGQYQPLVVGRGPVRGRAEGCGRRRPNAARCCRTRPGRDSAEGCGRRTPNEARCLSGDTLFARDIEGLRRRRERCREPAGHAFRSVLRGDATCPPCILEQRKSAVLAAPNLHYRKHKLAEEAGSQTTKL